MHGRSFVALPVNPTEQTRHKFAREQPASLPQEIKITFNKQGKATPIALRNLGNPAEIAR